MNQEIIANKIISDNPLNMDEADCVTSYVLGKLHFSAVPEWMRILSKALDLSPYSTEISSCALKAACKAYRSEISSLATQMLVQEAQTMGFYNDPCNNTC